MGICAVGATSAAAYGLFWAGTGAIGAFGYKELDKQIMHAIKSARLDEKVEKLWTAADEDGNGYLDEEEIIALTTKIIKIISDTIDEKISDPAKLSQAREYIKAIRSALAEPQQKQRLVDEVFKNFDNNKDGKISKEEFKGALLKIPKIFRSFVRGVFIAFAGFVGSMVVCTGCSVLGCTIGFVSCFGGGTKRQTITVTSS